MIFIFIYSINLITCVWMERKVKLIKKNNITEIVVCRKMKTRDRQDFTLHSSKKIMMMSRRVVSYENFIKILFIFFFFTLLW